MKISTNIPLSMNLSFLLLFVITLNCIGKITEEERKQKSLDLFASLGKDLRMELVKSIESAGVANSIEVCGKISPQMEEKISKENGLEIKRISDRFRNPKHSPKDWEEEVLERWKKEIGSGVTPSVFNLTVKGEQRVMKPIIIDNATCLKCHGEPIIEINKETLMKIQLVYPDDRATGYKLGDLRGAFSATWKI